jgi:hypothetical protein
LLLVAVARVVMAEVEAVLVVLEPHQAFQCLPAWRSPLLWGRAELEAEVVAEDPPETTRYLAPSHQMAAAEQRAETMPMMGCSHILVALVVEEDLEI